MGQGGRARAGTSTWPGIGGVRRAAARWPFASFGYGDRLATLLRQWAAADTAAGRLFPWLAIAFAAGIAIYFSASREPIWWAACGLAAFLIVLTFVARSRPVAFPVMLALSAAAVGFAVPTLKNLKVTHPRAGGAGL